MKLSIDHNIPAVREALARASSQIPYAMSVALNTTAAEARTMMQAEMKSVFDRPTPWVLNSLRIKYANKRNVEAELAFKDFNGASTRSMLEPQVNGGSRRFKAMEAIFKSGGYVPKGWNIVPGEAATLDQYGNIVRSQVSQLMSMLAMLGPMSPAQRARKAELAKRGTKRNPIGFQYFIIPVGSRSTRLQPGVYKRFASGVKPILIFVRPAKYRQRLDFFGLVEQKVRDRLPANFDAAFKAAVATSFARKQGGVL